MLNLNIPLTIAAVRKLAEQGQLSAIAIEVIGKQNSMYQEHANCTERYKEDMQRYERLLSASTRLYNTALAQQERAKKALLSAVTNHISDQSILEACVELGEAVDVEKEKRRLEIATIVCASGVYAATKNSDPLACHSDRQWFVKVGHVCPECFYILDTVDLAWLASNLEEAANSNKLSSNCF